MKHIGIWLALGALSKWRVLYRILVQFLAKMVVVAPNAYFHMWDMGASVSKDWCRSDGGSSTHAADLQPCQANCCQVSHILLMLSPLTLQPLLPPLLLDLNNATMLTITMLMYHMACASQKNF